MPLLKILEMSGKPYNSVYPFLLLSHVTSTLVCDRFGHKMIHGPDNQIFVFGGSTSASGAPAEASVEHYGDDPVLRKYALTKGNR